MSFKKERTAKNRVSKPFYSPKIQVLILNSSREIFISPVPIPTDWPTEKWMHRRIDDLKDVSNHKVGWLLSTNDNDLKFYIAHTNFAQSSGVRRFLSELDLSINRCCHCQYCRYQHELLNHRAANVYTIWKLLSIWKEIWHKVSR